MLTCERHTRRVWSCDVAAPVSSCEEAARVSCMKKPYVGLRAERLHMSLNGESARVSEWRGCRAGLGGA